MSANQPVEQGIVVSVAEVRIGDELAADAAAGALGISLTDAVDFNEGGGTLKIGGETIAYTSADLTTDVLELAAPLAGSYTAGERVYVVPEARERLADVELDEDGEAITARVPHALFDRVPEGIRDNPERVTLVNDGGEWVIADVLGSQPLVDASYADPATLPPATDSQPPASSPTPTVTPGIGVLFVTWTAVANADPVTYEVHVSATSGFTPSATTLAGEVQGTLAVLRSLHDGTLLAYGTTYYVRLVAKDADGPAPASAEASGAPVLVNSADVLDASLEMTKFAAGIRPPRVVNSLPTSPYSGYLAGDTVVLTTDNKLYRFTGSGWTVATAATDVTGQLVAGQIAAGAIGATQIAAGAVQTSHLLVTGENWVINPGFEDTSGPLLTPHLVQSGTTDGGSSTTHHSGGYSRLLTLPAIAAATNVLFVNGGASNIAGNPKVKVGETWRFAFWAQAASGTPTLRAAILTRDRSGVTTLQSQNGTAVATSGTWTQYEVKLTITSADAYYVFGWIQATLAAAGNQILVDDMELRRMAGGELIVDGAISAAKIAANTITGDKIAANTITAGNIAADTLTANELAAGAVTATEIAAGAIDGKTITGALIRTNASGKRVELTSAVANLIQGYSGMTGEVGPAALRLDVDDLGNSASLDLKSPDFGQGIAEFFLRAYPGIPTWAKLTAGSVNLEAGTRTGLTVTSSATFLGSASTGRGITKGIDFQTASYTSNASGYVNISHGLGVVPTVVFLTSASHFANPPILQWDDASSTATTFRVYFQDHAGALLTNQARDVAWIAIA